MRRIALTVHELLLCLAARLGADETIVLDTTQEGRVCITWTREGITTQKILNRKTCH